MALQFILKIDLYHALLLTENIVISLHEMKTTEKFNGECSVMQVIVRSGSVQS